MGHIKTICVLAGGALLFQEVITLRIAVGMTCAVLGMMGYGYYSHRETATSAGEGEGAPLKVTDERRSRNSVSDGEEEEVQLLKVHSTDSDKNSAARKTRSESG